MEKRTTSEKPEIIIEEGEDGLVISVPENVEVTIKKEEEKAVEKAPTATENLITLGLVGLLAIVVIIAVIRKAAANKKAAAATVEVEEIPAAPAPEAPKAPGSAGGVKLYNVEPKTAAMLMAIVADKLGKPLNELRFISIKEVEE